MSKVSLIGITDPRVNGLDTAEDLVAYAARVSNPANQTNTATAPKLLQYLAKNKHWSPFEMVHVVMEIVTTRDIARQILRHRSFSFQEFSQRYALVDISDFEIREARLQDNKNRQASLEIDDPELQKEWAKKQQEVIDLVIKNYTWAIENKIAKEVARAILPEGNTKSILYMAAPLRSWIHYTQVRIDMSTQKEHREIACQCATVLKEQFPSIAELLNENS